MTIREKLPLHRLPKESELNLLLLLLSSTSRKKGFFLQRILLLEVKLKIEPTL